MDALDIIIIEDNKTFRDVINFAIELDSSMHISAEYGTAEIALRDLESAPKKPDVCLLDLNLPGMHGHEALPKLLTYCPNMKVIVLSANDDVENVQKSMDLGASGFLSKTTDITDIRTTLRNL